MILYTLLVVSKNDGKMDTRLVLDSSLVLSNSTTCAAVDPVRLLACYANTARGPCAKHVQAASSC